MSISDFDKRVAELENVGKSEGTIASALRDAFGKSTDLPQDKDFTGKDNLISKVSAALKRIGHKKYAGSNQYQGVIMRDRRDIKGVYRELKGAKGS